MTHNTDYHRGLAVITIGLLLFVAYTGVTAALAPTPTPQQATAPGPVLEGAMGEGHDGRVTARHPNGTVNWQYGNALSYNDVSRLPNGSVLAAFQVKAHKCGQYPDPCMRTGVRIIDPDPEPHVEWTYTFPTRDGLNAEVHDAEYLEERGELLLVDMDRERVFTVDMQTREITWQWNASQHYTAPPDPTRTDWLHMNDVDKIGNGRYLVSVRNANQLIILNRSCTCITEIINQNSNRHVLYEQHNPQWLGDGRVLVADSENDRVVELHRTDGGDWEVVWEVHGAGGLQFEWPRDADRLPNGNTLVVDTHNNRVVEIDRQGNLVWSSETHGQPYDAEVNGTEGSGPAYDAATGAVYNQQSEQPLESVSYLYAGVQHRASLPAWVSDWHMLVALVSLAFVLPGAYLSLRGLFQRRRREAADRCGECGASLEVAARDGELVVGCRQCNDRVGVVTAD